MPPAQVSQYPPDPGYGTVPDLCTNLGYPPDLTYGRKGSTLAYDTVKYRKRVTKNISGVCPLDDEAPVMLEYAKGFLKEYSNKFFQYTPEGEALGWPNYPRDSEKIIAGLKKLMCLQEYFARKNYIQANGHPNFETMVATPNRPPKSPPPPAASLEQQSRQQVLHNIKCHLGYAYPSNSFPSSSTTWLFDKLKYDKNHKIKTELVDSFVVRYLHEHSLYKVDDQSRHQEMEQFVKDTIRHYKLECQINYHAWIKNRCHNIVERFVDSWKEWQLNGYGFLEEKNGTIRKNPLFEKAWKAQRTVWLRNAHNGKSANVIEWVVQPVLRSENEPGSKHTLAPTQPSSTGYAGKSCGEKRRKTETVQLEDNNTRIEDLGPRQTSEPSNNLLSNRAAESNLQSLVSNALEKTPYATFSASTNDDTIYVPRPDALASPAASSDSLPIERISHGALPRPLQMTPERRSISMKPSSDPSKIEVETPILLSVKNDFNSSLKTDLRAEFAATKVMSPSLSKVASISPDTELSKATLKFAIEDDSGIPDDENLSSENEILSLSLSDLFTLVSKKSDQLPEQLTQLTFRFRFAKASLVINKNGGEEAWCRQKRKLNRFFSDAQNEFPDRTDFEIWIYCGDRVARKVRKEETEGAD